MKVILFVCLMAASAIAASKPDAKSCATSSSGFAFSRPMKISKIESIQMESISERLKLNPDIPKLPFGFANPEWVAFKSRIRPGDKVVQYSTTGHAWQNLAGEAGYALIRSGCIVEKFTTLIN